MESGYFLKLKLLEKNYSQKELSQLIDVSVEQVSRIMNSRSIPSFDTLQKLTEVLNFTIEEFTEKTGIDYPEEEKNKRIIKSSQKNQNAVISKEPDIKEIIQETAEKTNKRIDFLTEMLKKVYEDDLKEGPVSNSDLPPGAIRMKPSTAKLPLVTGVKCGNFTCPAEETYEMISVPESWGEAADFVIQVSGDSMAEYKIHDGFYVAIKKQNTCSPGDIVLICDYDETDISKGVLKKAKSVNGIGLVFQNGTGDIIPMSESYKIEGIAVKWGML